MESELDRLQESTTQIKQAFPSFLKVYVADASGRVIASSPEIDDEGESIVGLSMADRSIFEETKRTLQPTMSEVHTDLADSNPHLGLTVPIVKDNRFAGLVYSSIALNQLHQLIQASIQTKNLQFTLVDRQNKAIASTVADQVPMENFHLYQDGEKSQLTTTIFHWLPTSVGNPMTRWKQSVYVKAMSISPEIPWKLYVAIPMGSYIDNLQILYIKNLSLMMAIALVAILLATILSRQLVSPLRRLAIVTTNLPEKLLEQETINWPDSVVTEIYSLLQNFQFMGATLERKFQEIKSAKDTLEHRVQERTQELSTINQELAVEIAQRQRAEVILRRQALTFENINDGIAIANVSGKITDWNPAAEKMFGYTKAEVLGKALTELGLAITDGDPMADPTEKSYVEMCLTDKQGRSVICETVLVPLRDEQSQAIIGTISVYHDITDRAAAQQALRISQERLKLALDSTEDGLWDWNITTGDCYFSPRWLEMLGYRPGDLEENISAWDPLVHPDDEETVTRELQVHALSHTFKGDRLLIVSESAAIRQTLRQFTAAWGMEVMEAPTGLAALKSLQAALTEHPYQVSVIELDSDNNPDQSERLDGQMLAQIIRLNPAWAQTQLIALTPMNWDEDLDGLKDGGFAAFVTKPIEESQLLECLLSLLPASRSLDNSENFSEIDPHSHPVNQASLIEQKPESATTPTFQKNQEFKILLAEDNITNRKVALHQLNLLGYEADAAADGQEVLEMLTQFDYDLILMDCQMPILDGYQTTQEIRRREGNDRHTVVIALTANAMKGDREKCLAAGMDDYLTKPVKIPDLEAMLKHWGDRSLPPVAEESSNSEQNLPHKSEQENIVDFEDLLKNTCQGDREFAEELLSAFLTDASNNVKLLQQAINQTDFDNAKYYAHQLKGASGNVRVKSIQAIAKQVEIMSQEKNLVNASDLVGQIEEKLLALQLFINQISGD